jgi:SAM-dependent methyltransferase
MDQQEEAEHQLISGSCNDVVPVDLNISHTVTDPAALTRQSYASEFQNIFKSKKGQIYNNHHVYLSIMAEALCHAEHPKSADKEEVLAMSKKVAEFNIILQELLGRKVSFDMDANGGVVPTIGERVYQPSQYSIGERLLICWSMYIFFDVGSLHDIAVVIEEPETHIHPEACVSVLNMLAAALKASGSQLWIATHSASIVSHFSDASLYYVENGVIEFASYKLDMVMDGLLGGRDARVAMRDHLDDVDSLAMLTFCAECFVTPLVFDKERDTQSEQLSQLVRQRVQVGEPIRILDYAAGKGRFASALANALKRRESTVDIEYFAYDHRHYAVHVEERNARVHNLDAVNRVRAEACESMTQFGPADAKLDIIVMANLLHELPPSEWAARIAECKNALCEDGCIWVFEAETLNVGELPNEIGYLLMHHEELQLLFDAGTEVVRVAEDKECRTSVVELPRRVLERMDPNTVKKALLHLAGRSMEEVKRLRKPGTIKSDHRAARQHAFHTVQHVNACLALQQLGVDVSVGTTTRSTAQ